ncbi:MAG: DUF177 domain-containing protein [Lentisphaerae bacterium]|nr:DUF177 domain-containing protein [Lentisphaerota bacterium]
MQIDLKGLQKGPRRYRGEEDPVLLDVGDRGISAQGPLRYDLTAELAGHELVVRGTVRVEMEFCCVRCAEPFTREIRDDAVLLTHRVEDLPGGRDASGGAAGAALVDLTEDIRESMILLFPSHPVCGEACRGLCPQCGRNLNRGRCACRPPADARWKSLDKLKLDA